MPTSADKKKPSYHLQQIMHQLIQIFLMNNKIAFFFISHELTCTRLKALCQRFKKKHLGLSIRHKRMHMENYSFIQLHNQVLLRIHPIRSLGILHNQGLRITNKNSCPRTWVFSHTNPLSFRGYTTFNLGALIKRRFRAHFGSIQFTNIY